MFNDEHTLFDEFTYKGKWWLPNKSDNTVHGSLHFLQNEISLELHGCLDTFDNNKSGAVEIILGIAESGEIISLVDSFIKRRWRSPNYEKVEYISNFILVGQHYNSKKEIISDASILSIYNLEEWLLNFPYKWLDNNIQISKIKDRHYEYFKEKVKIEIRNTYTFSEGSTSVSSSSTSTIIIKCEEPKSCEWFLSFATKIPQLLTIISGDPFLIKSIDILGDQIELNGNSKIRPHVRLFFYYNTSLKPQNKYFPEFSFNFKDFEDYFEDIINKWYELYEKFDSVFLSAMNYCYMPPPSLETRFLNLMQAIECYHRLKYGSNFSLKERLKALTQVELSKYMSLREAINESLVETFVKTRNYYTHYDNTKKEGILKGSELYWNTQKLYLILRVLLLSELNISQGLIEKRVLEDYKVKQILKM
jgi:hypothetical protein